jgi:hypothetical protein
MVASSSHGSSGGHGNSFERHNPNSVPQMSSSLSTITAGAQGGISGITVDILNTYSGMNLSLVSENVSNEEPPDPIKERESLREI